MHRRSWSVLPAPLPFARNAVVVSIHLGPWAVFEEVGGLGAGGHLGTMGTPVARETSIRGTLHYHGLWDCVGYMRPTLRLRVAVPTRKDEQRQQDDGFHCGER